MANEMSTATLDASRMQVGDFAQLAHENRKGLAQTSANRKPIGVADSFLSNQKQLLRTALQITGTLQDAEDCCSSALVKALEQESQGVAMGNVGGLLHRITRNLAIDCVRKRKGMSSIDAMVEAIADDEQMPTVTNMFAGEIIAMATTKVEKRVIRLLMDDDNENPHQAASQFNGSRYAFYQILTSLQFKLGCSPTKRLTREAQFQMVPKATGETVQLGRGGCTTLHIEPLFVTDLQAAAIMALAELSHEWTVAHFGELLAALEVEHVG